MTWDLLHGDCRTLMAEMEGCSVDSVVTDAPYELGFMGREWDRTGVAYDVATWRAAWQVLKPGGWLVCFGGSRTYHRMACAIEDAGFEIRDQIMWIYGSGFPKGGNRDGKGTCLKPAHEPIVLARKPLIGSVARNEAAFGTGPLNIDACRVHGEDAQGGAYTVKRLKPGRWPANIIHDGSDDVVAAFPAAPGQLRAVGPEHGTKPSVNVYGDFGARDHFAPRGDSGSAARFFKSCSWEESEWLDQNLPHVFASIVDGHIPLPSLLAAFAQSDAVISALPAAMRFAVVTAPSINVTLSECVRIGALLIKVIQNIAGGSWLAPQPDELILSSGHVRLVARQAPTGIIMTMTDHSTSNGSAEAAIFSITPESVALGVPDLAAKLRYCAKASKADRDEGLDHLEPQAFVQFQTGNGESGQASSLSEGRDTQYRNIHPTVKPEALMRWLVRLVTPAGGTVLDPFSGSGSTGKAAILEGRSFIGCELTAEYLPIARARIAAASRRAAEEAARAAAPPVPQQIPLFAEAANG